MNDDDERYVRRQGYTRQEIHKMPFAELDAALAREEKLLAKTEARSTWDSRPMKRRPDESAGEFSSRRREAARVDQKEYARVVRTAYENALWNSKSERLKRLMDSMSANITKESAEADRKVIDDLHAKERRESFFDGLGFPEK